MIAYSLLTNSLESSVLWSILLYITQMVYAHESADLRFISHSLVLGDTLGDSSSNETQTYPPPHDTSRADGMDTNVYEVKWSHRDDCVSALMVILLSGLIVCL